MEPPLCSHSEKKLETIEKCLNAVTLLAVFFGAPFGERNCSLLYGALFVLLPKSSSGSVQLRFNF